MLITFTHSVTGQVVVEEVENRTTSIREAVGRASFPEPILRFEAYLGDLPLDPESTLEESGVEDGARLTVEPVRITVEVVVEPFFFIQ